ncbi:hypothetical protein NMY22_g1312 [Coprinellus aureogranulatus]|nr:hypothetical protein NMY22_g1312 [Coprinellus aureogranulatus]
MDSAGRPQVDERAWERVTRDGAEWYSCVCCTHVCARKNRLSHETGLAHRDRFARYLRQQASAPIVTPHDIDQPVQAVLLNAAEHIVHTVGHPGQPFTDTSILPVPGAGHDNHWGIDTSGDLEVYPTAEEEAVVRAREAALDLEERIFALSDDEGDERDERSDDGYESDFAEG